MEKREKFRIMNSWLWSKDWIILVIWKNRCLGRRAYAKSPPTPLSRIHSLRGASPLEKILIFDVIFLDCLFKVTFGSSLELCTNENRALRFLIGNTHIDIYIYISGHCLGYWFFNLLNCRGGCELFHWENYVFTDWGALLWFYTVLSFWVLSIECPFGLCTIYLGTWFVGIFSSSVWWKGLYISIFFFAEKLEVWGTVEVS